MANLSNINNKFLVTTGGNILIGQTSAVGSSILQVTGSVNITGGTTSGLNITTSGTQDTININRAANNDNAITKYQTASADKWIVGLRNTGDDNFRFYSYGTSSDVLTIDQANGNSTFAGSVTVNSPQGDVNIHHKMSGNGGFDKYSNVDNGTYGYIGTGSHLLTPVVNNNDFVVRAEGEFAVSIAAAEKFRIDSSGNSTFAGPIYLLNTNARISAGGSGEVGFNYNTGATGSLVWYGGGTASKFNVTNTGNATFSGNILFGTDGTYDIGSTAGGRPRNVVVSNSIAINTSTGAAGTLNAGSTGTFVDGLIVNGSYPGLVLNSTSYTKFAITNRYSSNYVTFDMTPQGGSTIEAVTLKNNGNVGIGVNPDTRLDIFNGNDFTNVLSTTNMVRLKRLNNDGNGQVNGIYMGVSGDNGTSNAWAGMVVKQAVTGSNAGDLIFTTRGFSDSIQERMRITSTGDVLINLTGPITTRYSTSIGTTLASGYSWFASNDSVYVQRPNGTNGNAISFRASVSTGSISLSGSATAYNTSSDYRLKEDLQDFAGLDKVSKIPVYDFKWKSDESRSYGVMAHELQEVLPDGVSGEKDAEEMQGVDYSKIVPLLIKAIQELKAEIELLKSK